LGNKESQAKNYNRALGDPDEKERKKSNRNLAKLLLKELTEQLKEEEQSYEAFALRLVGGDKSPYFSLSCKEVLSFGPSSSLVKR